MKKVNNLKRFAAFIVAVVLVTGTFAIAAPLTVSASTARSPFTIHAYAYLLDTPDIYWVGTSNRTDGVLNGYKFIAPSDMEIRLKPAKWHHSFNIYHGYTKDGKSVTDKIEMPARSAERTLKLKAGDELALQITLYYPEGGGNWARSSLPYAIEKSVFETWYTEKGGVVEYAGGYSTIPKWTEFKTATIAGLSASLVTLPNGDKEIRFVADKDMAISKWKTKTDIEVYRVTADGDWSTLEADKWVNIKKGDTLIFNVKTWELAVLVGDVKILTK